jgi:hypothetical protein
MAVQLPIPVRCEDVLPAGAYALAVEPINDFEKIAAPHEPIPPDAMPGTPFRPVEFDGLVLMPYVDTNRAEPRIAFSLRAKSMRVPAAARPAKAS